MDDNVEQNDESSLQNLQSSLQSSESSSDRIEEQSENVEAISLVSYQIQNETVVETIEEQLINLYNDELRSLCSIMRCAAHCAQLASVHVTSKYDAQFSKIRKFVHNCDKIQHHRIFSNLKKPRIENTTRWNSSYNMVHDLCTLKAEYRAIDHPDFELASEIWQFAEEYEAAFSSVSEALLIFQKSSITMSKLKEAHIRITLIFIYFFL